MEITASEFQRRAQKTAEHFGFQATSAFKKNRACKDCTTNMPHTAGAIDRRQDALGGLLANGITAYADERLYAIEEPVFYYSLDQVPRSGEAALTLQVFNVEKSIAEAILIQTTRAILKDMGMDNHCVRINSLGDRDSIARYSRELTNYLRKRVEDLPPAARELLKDHSFTALMHLIEKEHELAHKSPSPLEYLSDQSRKHFREIVEFLDMSETPYEIDSKLIGHHQCYQDAMFAIDLLDDNGVREVHEPVLVRGGRYSNFMQKHTKQNVSAVGAVMVLRNKKAPIKQPRNLRAGVPSVYVVQLGFGPKVKSLLLIDSLREAGVPVYQNLACDSLSTQLRDAEAKGVKYTVIIGQKEFVDGTVILRDMMGRNQEPVLLPLLVNKLKKTCL